MKHADLMREAEQVIEERLAAEGVAPKSWIVKEMIDRHPGIGGDDSDWYRICAFVAIDSVVRGVLQRHRAQEAELDIDRQEVLPGFKRLQRRYSIERDGEQTVVELERMTVIEGRAKAHELREMAKGCLAHAEELDDYFDQRPQQSLPLAP
jgi:hypothetical protein